MRAREGWGLRPWGAAILLSALVAALVLVGRDEQPKFDELAAKVGGQVPVTSLAQGHVVQHEDGLKGLLGLLSKAVASATAPAPAVRANQLPASAEHPTGSADRSTHQSEAQTIKAKVKQTRSKISGVHNVEHPQGLEGEPAWVLGESSKVKREEKRAEQMVRQLAREETEQQATVANVKHDAHKVSKPTNSAMAKTSTHRPVDASQPKGPSKIAQASAKAVKAQQIKEQEKAVLKEQKEEQMRKEQAEKSLKASREQQLKQHQQQLHAEERSVKVNVARLADMQTLEEFVATLDLGSQGPRLRSALLGGAGIQIDSKSVCKGLNTSSLLQQVKGVTKVFEARNVSAWGRVHAAEKERDGLRQRLQELFSTYRGELLKGQDLISAISEMSKQRDSQDSSLKSNDLSLKTQIHTTKDEAAGLIEEVSLLDPVLFQAQKRLQEQSSDNPGLQSTAADKIRRSAARVESALKEKVSDPESIEGVLNALQDLSLNPSSLQAQTNLNVGIQDADNKVLSLEATQSKDRQKLLLDHKTVEKLRAKSMKLEGLTQSERQQLTAINAEIKRHEVEIRHQSDAVDELRMKAEVLQASAEHAQVSAQQLNGRIEALCPEPSPVAHVKPKVAAKQPPPLVQKATSNKAPDVQKKRHIRETNAKNRISAPKAQALHAERSSKNHAAASSTASAPALALSPEDLRVLRSSRGEGVRAEERDEESYASQIASNIINSNTDEV